MSRRLIAYGLAGGVVVLWGASFVTTKLALLELGPQGIAFLRWLISTATLVGWLAATRKLPILGQLLHQETWNVIWVALTGITLFYLLENLALHYTTAVNTGILINLTSVFMALLGTFWLKEKLAVSGWLAMAIAFVGAALVSRGTGHLEVSGAGRLGDTLVIVAAFLGALYSVGGKRLVAGFPTDVVTTAVAVVGTTFLLPLALWEGMSLRLSPVTWGALVILGLGSSALANIGWMYLLSYTDATRAGMILLFIPLFSTALAAIVLHEPITLTMLFGAALVLAGMAVVIRP